MKHDFALLNLSFLLLFGYLIYQTVIYSSVLTAKPRQEIRPSVKVFGQSPFVAGTTIYFQCMANGQKPVRWFMDDVDISGDSNNPRIQV